VVTILVPEHWGTSVSFHDTYETADAGGIWSVLSSLERVAKYWSKAHVSSRRSLVAGRTKAP
jgi:hypothetical protein